MYSILQPTHTNVITASQQTNKQTSKPIIMFCCAKSSLFSVQLLLVVVVVLMATTSVDAKILDLVLQLFDAPSRVDSFADAPGHFAEKTIEFLAFGDAATDYYQS